LPPAGAAPIQTEAPPAETETKGPAAETETKAPPAEPETKGPPAEAETKEQLTTFAEKNFGGFTQFSPQKVEEITNQAAAGIQAIAAKSNIPPEEVPKAAQLAFYDFVILYGLSTLLSGAGYVWFRQEDA
jgi:hypothetical protein